MLNSKPTSNEGMSGVAGRNLKSMSLATSLVILAGSDISSNIIVLCPNHHVQCDYGSIAIDLDSVRTDPLHRISSEFIDWHNSHTVLHLCEFKFETQFSMIVLVVVPCSLR